MSDERSPDRLELLPPLEELAERLLDAAAAGRFSEELALARLVFDTRPDALGEEERFCYRTLFFDLAQVSTADRRLQISVAIDLLAGAGEPAWMAILRTSRIDDLRRLAGEPDMGVELAELLSYAPDPGIRDFAISELEATGMRWLAVGEDSRSLERLLHATGGRDEAYRLEAARKQRAAVPLPALFGRPRSEPNIPYRVIAIVGGHAQLRGAAAAVLERYGVTVVQIPSSQEAVRRGRDIVLTLQGCDLAFLLVRQLTHSTSDQVRKSAERLGIPVIFSNASSAVAIERQLLDRGKSD